MNTEQVIAQFAGVSLDQLVEEAELLKRIDRKYLVPARSVAAVLKSLPSSTRALEIDGQRNFAYRSVYFDTPELLSFRMAAQPRRRRFKVRTRTYVDTGKTYLEIKTKGARDATVKERTEHPLPDRLTRSSLVDIRSALAAVGVADDLAGDLAPTLITTYKRATLLIAGGTAADPQLSRATIDTELEWEDAEGNVLSLDDFVVVETKSGSTASPVDRALWTHGFRPRSVSKYATGLAAMHPELPRNKWTRVLRESFDIARQEQKQKEKNHASSYKEDWSSRA